MNIRHPEQETPVELVSDLNEGRLAYIADMARQLSLLASAAGESRLVDLLDAATREAVARSQKVGARLIVSTLK